MVDFPVHNPDFPDVDPATGDERETTEGEAVGSLTWEVDDHGHCCFGGCDPMTCGCCRRAGWFGYHRSTCTEVQFETAPPEEYDF